MKITIGAETFPTKKAAEDRCRSILHEHKAKPRTAIDPVCFFFMLDVLERHPDANEKIGVGVESIFVDADGYGGVCFWLRRSDGTATDFSFKHCITPHTPMHDFRAAARRTIRDQVFGCLDAAFASSPTIRCVVTGETIDRRSAHVDHEAPNTFAVLIDKFIASRGIDVASVAIRGYEDGATERGFYDFDLTQDWYQFHRQNARLRVISIRANLSVTRRQP